MANFDISTLPSRSVFGNGVLEPVRGLFAFTVANDGILTGNVTRRAFVDAIGQNQAGGLSLVQGDYNISSGLIPSGIAYVCEALSAFVHEASFAAEVDAATAMVLSANIWLQLMYAGNLYDLGLLGDYLGPYAQVDAARTSVDVARRFGWLWMDESRPLVLEPGQQFWLQAQTLRTVTGVTPGTWVTRVNMPCLKVTQGVAAVKQ